MTYQIVASTSPIGILQKIQKENPVIYQLILRQQETKWEVITGGKFKTADSSSTERENAEITKFLNSYPL